MGFEILYQEGKNRPVVHCDFCGKSISDFKMANVLWDPGDFKSVNHSTEVVHKNCSNAHEKKMGNRHWMSLNQYVSWLLWNAGYGKKKVGNGDEDSILVPVPRPMEIDL